MGRRLSARPPMFANCYLPKRPPSKAMRRCLLRTGLQAFVRHPGGARMDGIEATPRGAPTFSQGTAQSARAPGERGKRRSSAAGITNGPPVQGGRPRRLLVPSFRHADPDIAHVASGVNGPLFERLVADVGFHDPRCVQFFREVRDTR